MGNRDQPVRQIDLHERIQTVKHDPKAKPVQRQSGRNAYQNKHPATLSVSTRKGKENSCGGIYRERSG
jgi:hypothetical protein